VLSQLLALGKTLNGLPVRQADAAYVSLMVCFLMHNISAAESLLSLRNSFGTEWFPATVGYLIARSMFETDVTAHYITQAPSDRARQYVLFEHILNKQEMDACSKHRKSSDPQWREVMDAMWRGHWASREQEVLNKYAEVRHLFEASRRTGKADPFRNWSGKSIRQMAVEVAHEEAYDVFYSELSSFTHADVRLANRFLRSPSGDLSWSMRAREFDVGNVFRHAASFLTCYLTLFGQQFDLWQEEDVQRCWDVDGS
jgi:hypothetical protein